MFMTEEGKDVSPWHDVALRNDDGEALPRKLVLAGAPAGSLHLDQGLWLCRHLQLCLRDP